MKLKNIKNIEPMSAVQTQLLGENGRNGTFSFLNPPRIIGRFSVAGKNESKGTFGKYFDLILPDCRNGEKSYEKAECAMFVSAIDGALASAGLNETEIDMLVGGDLLNQIVSMNYAARCYGLPFLGLYNACATSCEALTIASVLISGGFCKKVACCTGSHFAAAERQYRGPLELGCQKAPYAQSTVTGGGCCIVGAGGAGVKITGATVGKVMDYGVKDVLNMSAAMAPAAMDTLTRHFKNTQTSPMDYDVIVTGDLGKLGEDILREMMRKEGFEMPNYIDCGHMMYSAEQHLAQGGSGAGCSMSVLNAFFLPKLERAEYRKILFCATGALMNVVLSQQGETIPSIAHAVVLESE